MVRVFFSTKANEPITPELIDLGQSQDRIASRESPSDWGFQSLDRLWQMHG
jgi:hypothetical protein